MNWKEYRATQGDKPSPNPQDQMKEGLRQIQRIAHSLTNCPDEDGDCPCYEEGIRDGQEHERRPLHE